MNGRNILGVEWVLPNGEILRLGSLGSGAGWFCGDGPGPSLRGIIRGSHSLLGGLGVFTKAATKVYHWPGPPVPTIEGVSPSYTMKPLPEIHCFYLVFPSWEKLVEAGSKIAESEIAYIIARISKYQLAADISTSNEECARLFSKILKSTKGVSGLLVIISANTRREFNYQEKVLKEILVETEGDHLPLLEECNIQGGVMWRFTRVSDGIRQYLRSTGGDAVACGTWLTWGRIPGIQRAVAKVRQKYIRGGLIMNDGADRGLSIFIEHGHFVKNEVGAAQYDPTNHESRQMAILVRGEVSRLGQKKYKCAIRARDHTEHDILGPQLGNYHLWLRRIKKVFDPNIASDPNNYIKPREEGEGSDYDKTRINY